MATLNSAAEGFRAVRPHFQAESSRPEKKAPLKRYFVAASVLLACLLAIILATLLLIGSPNPTWSRSEHSRLSSRLAGLADWEGSATANAPPVGQQLALQTMVGVRHIARSAVSLPLQESSYVDSNPRVPVNSGPGAAWGPSRAGPNLPGTLGDQAKQTTMGGPTAHGNWESETCVEPPCGLGIPQPELSGGPESGDNPGRVAGWLGRQTNKKSKYEKHMRVSSAGPGFLARIPRPQPVFSSGYTMSRHLHWALMSACEDQNTSLEGTADCVRRNGRSVQQALTYLMWGPTAREREAAVGKNGLFAGRMFQRYLKSDPYLIGEDWPRSVLRFPDYNDSGSDASTSAVQAQSTSQDAAAEETLEGACARFSVTDKAKVDMSHSTRWAPITAASSTASGVSEAQCCALCLIHAQCQAWQLEDPGFCRLLQALPARGRIPQPLLKADRYSKVGLLSGLADADEMRQDENAKDGDEIPAVTDGADVQGAENADAQVRSDDGRQDDGVEGESGGNGAVVGREMARGANGVGDSDEVVSNVESSRGEQSGGGEGGLEPAQPGTVQQTGGGGDGDSGQDQAVASEAAGAGGQLGQGVTQGQGAASESQADADQAISGEGGSSETSASEHVTEHEQENGQEENVKQGGEEDMIQSKGGLGDDQNGESAGVGEEDKTREPDSNGISSREADDIREVAGGMDSDTAGSGDDAADGTDGREEGAAVAETSGAAPDSSGSSASTAASSPESKATGPTEGEGGAGAKTSGFGDAKFDAEIGINFKCYSPSGVEVPCLEDGQPCGDDDSGRGPEVFDSTCLSNQCGWACTDATSNILESIMDCISCDGGQCRCIGHATEQFVRRLENKVTHSHN